MKKKIYKIQTILFNLILFLFLLVQNNLSAKMMSENTSIIDYYKEAKKFILMGDSNFSEGNYNKAEKNYSIASKNLKKIKKKFPEWNSMVLVDIQLDRCVDKVKEIESISMLDLDKKKNKKKQAEQIYLIANKERRYNKFILFNKKADGFLAVNNYKKAIEFYDKALSIDSSDNYIKANKAVALFKSNKLQKAKKIYKKIIKESPDFVPAYYNLADIYYSTGDFDKAIDSYQKSISLDAEDMRSRINIGVIYVKKGSYNKALNQFEYVLNYMPDSLDVHYNLGIIFSDYLFDTKKAIYHFSKYLDINPNAQDAGEVKAWIASLNQ